MDTCYDEIGPMQQKPPVPVPDGQEPLLPLAEIERIYIEMVVKRVGGNLSQAARVLKIDRTTLYNKLKRYGLR